MNIYGYSERGAVNAVLFDISYSPRSNYLLRQFLKCAQFQNGISPRLAIDSATILIEQSLSDFGDADAILLIDHENGKTAVFIEAKIKSAQKEVWALQEQFTAFQRGLELTLHSSNLFTQLYHKVRFVDAAQCNTLHSGVDFPSCSTKTKRYIGSNPVVLRAVKKIKPYLDNAYYIGLVPETTRNVETFFPALSSVTQTQLIAWDASHWGFISWETVYEFCDVQDLQQALRVLNFNREQIF